MSAPQLPDDFPREPMPRSLSPLWRFMLFILGVIVAIAAASAVVALAVR